jgi:hypothetical protein
MKKLRAKGQKWLKCFHIFFSCLWVGAAVSLVISQAGLSATDGKMLYGIDMTRKFIDDFIIIPGAVGSLITGLLYSIYTNWGFFKHNWITVKWVINIGGVIFGTFWLGAWLNGCPPISKELGLGALSDPTYVHYATMNKWFGAVQALTIIFAVFISVLKPWGKMKEK